MLHRTPFTRRLARVGIIPPDGAVDAGTLARVRLVLARRAVLARRRDCLGPVLVLARLAARAEALSSGHLRPAPRADEARRHAGPRRVLTAGAARAPRVRRRVGAVSRRVEALGADGAK